MTRKTESDSRILLRQTDVASWEDMNKIRNELEILPPIASIVLGAMVLEKVTLKTISLNLQVGVYSTVGQYLRQQWLWFSDGNIRKARFSMLSCGSICTCLVLEVSTEKKWHVVKHGLDVMLMLMLVNSLLCNLGI